MTPLDLAEAFLQKGRGDEALLERIVSDVEIADWLFGFHAQQAVEKYLKAVLAIGQERPERTHDLGVLAEQCRQSGHALPEDLEGISDLSRYAVQERYPLALTPPVDRAAALDLVVRVRAWVEDVVAA
ncbi:MAG: HEPN domain-containing protein [Actinomycetota bacterium]